MQERNCKHCWKPENVTWHLPKETFFQPCERALRKAGGAGRVAHWGRPCCVSMSSWIRPQHPHEKVSCAYNPGWEEVEPGRSLVLTDWFCEHLQHLPSACGFQVHSLPRPCTHTCIHTHTERKAWSDVRFHSPAHPGDFLCCQYRSLWVLFRMIHLVHLHQCLIYRLSFCGVLCDTNGYRVESLWSHTLYQHLPPFDRCQRNHWYLIY